LQTYKTILDLIMAGASSAQTDTQSVHVS